MPSKKKPKIKGAANINLPVSSSNDYKEPSIKNQLNKIDQILPKNVSQDINIDLSKNTDIKDMQTNNLNKISCESSSSKNETSEVAGKISENIFSWTNNINNLLKESNDMNATYIEINLTNKNQMDKSEKLIIESNNKICNHTIEQLNNLDISEKSTEKSTEKSNSKLKAERRAIQEKQRALKETSLKPPQINQSNAKELTSKSQEKKDQPNSIEIKNESGEKSKIELKAERRALQEHQRALKAAGLKPQPQKVNLSSEIRTDSIKTNIQGKQKSEDSKENTLKLNESETKIIKKKSVISAISRRKTVSLFGHLQQYFNDIDITKDISLQSKFNIDYIHPEILTIGLQMANGKLSGSNLRALATLNALKHIVEDYTTPPDKEFSRELLNHLKPNINFLKKGRTISASMGNCIKFFKHRITKLPDNITEIAAKSQLISEIEEFANEKIYLAGEIIANEYGLLKIDDGDVILIYGGSSLVLKVLCSAFDKGKLFNVIVMDGRPKMEGKELLRKLVRHGIECTYACISALTYHMPLVSKVIMGAHGLLANGSVMSTIGSSQVALVASFFNVSVIVMCESYKFCQRVQTDSFVFNELGDPTAIVETSTYLKSRYKDLTHLLPLNLIYDVTPQNLVSMVVTDVGLVPCTSVPVVLRVKNFASNL